MTYTYDPRLPTDKDWVRFLVGDRNMEQAVLSDEEIRATLSIVSNVYCAAALCAQTAVARTGGVVEKQVGDLTIKYSDQDNSSYSDHIDWLREQCAGLMSDTPVFSMLTRRCLPR
jgi:hypothetical protein